MKQSDNILYRNPRVTKAYNTQRVLLEATWQAVLNKLFIAPIRHAYNHPIMCFTSLAYVNPTEEVQYRLFKYSIS